VNSASSALGKRLRIIVLGYVVRWPLGGMVWSNLHYLMGLARLGYDVYFVEDSDDYPSCYDPARGLTDTDPTYGLEFARRTFERIGLGERWAYHDAHTSCWFGPCAGRAVEICKEGDLLLNLACVNPLRSWLTEVPCRAYVDEDPAFTQVRNLTRPEAHNRALQHTIFLSFGENIGRSGSAIPTDGLPWQPTRQPVVLDVLPVTPGPSQGRFTAVMQWESYQPLEYGGVCYGMKSEVFLPYVDLPGRAGRIFELAVGSASAPRELLRRKGWALRDPLEAPRDPWTYEDFIRRSKAEFGVVKHGYVVSRSGWFSERSACYLASGRPVLMQETGFSDWLPTGAGVFSFATPEEALAGIQEINSRYEYHCRAAREIAEAYFDARKVLSELIERAMNPPFAPVAGTVVGESS
jgi:hypothetical protein